MRKNNYFVIGVMSGTSLDGIDLAYIHFSAENNYDFEILEAQTVGYAEEWREKLNEGIDLNEEELQILDKNYTKYLADVILEFIAEYNIENLDAICSHGHTIKHEPQNGYTLQIGNLPEIAEYLQNKVVCDFRVQDVALGGQGAPLVPIGDQLLFNEYQYCLNLGGFANISEERNDQMLAYDICAVNTVLNYFTQKLGKAYDDKGQIASEGRLHEKLLQQLNNLNYYSEKPPKSLGIEWVKAEVLPLISSEEIPIPDILHTYTIHVAQQVAKVLNNNKESKVLVTGGGAFNDFLVQQFKEYSNCEFIIPNAKIIDFKEALIFGLLGVLKLEEKVNVLSSVTGAKKDHSSGKVFAPKRV
ncbi:anhydro-N-acetylmuramic acid kinase [Zunongwangia endophytica]|uniref:Anhydro-N-acetylmuramic acid kinase n=1 Tax=Zunongwangia endophytica TaxID=1808945 RepID=A0ABV8H4B1_9FLAO|nr:anhydro-N-acetylmuramic acid kinase [Zunongwangia endophytica]MDN3596374.1 anhydro-N-acetylmuramic acid kinase [Zunongwangia endophytica]